MSSSDTGPRKRFKDKKRKKGSLGEINLPNTLQQDTASKKFVLDETIHVQKDVHVGGNVLSKIIFVSVLLLLGISLMYMLSQKDIREGTDSNAITPWLSNLIGLNYIWSEEKEQQNDDIEPKEISEYSYWDYLFPFFSFIQKTYEEPENFEKEFTQEAENKDNLEAEELDNEEKEKDDDNDEQTSADRDDFKKQNNDDENDSNSREDNEGDADEETASDRNGENYGSGYQGSYSSYKFDTYEYDNDDEAYKKDDLEEGYNDIADNESELGEEERYYGNSEDEKDEGAEERNESNEDNDSEEENDENHAETTDYNYFGGESKDDSEESSNSFDEDVEKENEGESANEEETQSSHVITKLGVGVALIFVAYTVIIRKWNNYVHQDERADVPEAERTFDQPIRTSEDSVPRNENGTLQQYMETPSASESENELEYSPDAALAYEIEEGESYTGTSGSDVNDSDTEPSRTFDYYTSNYDKTNITNEYDWRYKDDLDDADEDFDRGKLDNALGKYKYILRRGEHSVRARYGIARVLDRKAEILKSNKILADAIAAYEDVLAAANTSDCLFKSVADRVSDRMQFKGEYGRAVVIQQLLIKRFPEEVNHQINLVVTLLMQNRMSEAEMKLEEILRKWPNDGMALALYGLVLKLKGDLETGIRFLESGINTLEPGTRDGRFYYHMGDALQKLRRDTEAIQVYEKGVLLGIFPSKYQRSLYNVDRLTARPWWSLKQSTYSSFFKTLEANWKTIRDEALQLLQSGKKSPFREESEQLREVGDWRQFELFSRGVKSPQCDRVPFTCRTVGDFQPAAGCRRGQVKFSIMEPGTHVWPHCGPTNCRLRAHLGLVVPSNVSIRVADRTKTWNEGRVLLFDDSFEHEVWHHGTTYRLILIVDVWHPELTEYERKTLSAI